MADSTTTPICGRCRLSNSEDPQCHFTGDCQLECHRCSIRTLSAVAAHSATEREVKTTRLAELPWSKDDCGTTRVSRVGRSFAARPNGLV